jgi:hypothetical protein
VKSQAAYRNRTDEFFSTLVSTTQMFGNLVQSGQKLFRLVSKESQNGLMSKILPKLAHQTGSSSVVTGAMIPGGGMVLPELSVAAPMLATGGMLLLIMSTLQGIHDSIDTLSEEIFMHKVRDLDGAREAAKMALLAVTNADYKGFQDSAYIQLKKEFSSFCGTMNDKILQTNPEDENMFASVFRRGDKWVKICNAMRCGVKSLIDTITVSSDLCCSINPLIAYNDRVEDLKELGNVNFDRLAEILHYVDHEQFAPFESYVVGLPGKITKLVEAQDKKPVLIFSSNQLSLQKENAHG